MARRSDHSREELNALIMDAAWEIVGKQGFEALTARKLAQQIGYTPGTIYNLFKSMDDLYLHVNARSLDVLYGALEKCVKKSAGKPLEKRLKDMARTYLKFAHDYKPYWHMMFSHPLPENRKTKDWYSEKIDQLFVPLESLVAPLCKDVHDPKFVARAIWSSVHGLCYLQESGRANLVDKKANVEKISGFMIDTVISGLKG